MTLAQVSRKVVAEHGVVASFAGDFFGYFGWPSVGRMEDGTLVAVASGMRNEHVCPFGRTVICYSRDDGHTWTSPRVVNDSPCDDRDAGVTPLDDRGLLITWFTTDGRAHVQERVTAWEKERPCLAARWRAGVAGITDENAARFVGSWVRISEDLGQSWDSPIRVPVTAPHGPIRLRSGELLYLGKIFGRSMVPLPAGTGGPNYHEPHVVELPSGKLLGMIRMEESGTDNLKALGIVDFSLAQTESEDGGRTWSEARPLNFHASPPHLIGHSSGAIVCVYGYREKPYGERAMISRDDGATWEYDYILRDDGPDWDLGYPSSVEVSDGSIFTLYYQKVADPS